MFVLAVGWQFEQRDSRRVVVTTALTSRTLPFRNRILAPLAIVAIEQDVPLAVLELLRQRLSIRSIAGTSSMNGKSGSRLPIQLSGSKTIVSPPPRISPLAESVVSE